jgi:hypothetical protein
MDCKDVKAESFGTITELKCERGDGFERVSFFTGACSAATAKITMPSGAVVVLGNANQFYNYERLTVELRVSQTRQHFDFRENR